MAIIIMLAMAPHLTVGTFSTISPLISSKRGSRFPGKAMNRSYSAIETAFRSIAMYPPSSRPTDYLLPVRSIKRPDHICERYSLRFDERFRLFWEGCVLFDSAPGGR